jgi:hypothetical protein
VEKMSVYTDALNAFGLENQRNKAIEELAELTKELALNGQGKKNFFDIASEIADVYVVLKQMEIGLNIEFTVRERLDYKLERLRKLIQNTNERRIYD